MVRRAPPGAPAGAAALRALAAALVASALAVGAAAAAGAAPRVPPFRHVIVVVFENKARGAVLGSSRAPAFDALARRGAVLAGYSGVTHPSLPNYLALVSGSTHGITSDCTGCVVDAPSLANTLAQRGRTWKTYAEGLPRTGSTTAAAGRYAKKHDPFVYFRSVLDRPARLRRVVDFRRFGADVAAGRLPSFSLLVPDLCNSMHDCSVETGDRWLRRNIAPLASKRLPKTVVFVLFDEGATSARGGGLVDAFAFGSAVRAGVRYRPPVDHYNVLRTVEDAWGLRRLAESAHAAPITGIWR